MQTPAFTAGERAHAFLLVAAVEVKAAAIRAAGHLEFAHGQNVQAAGHVFPDGFFIRQVVAVLVNKRHLHGLAEFDLAAVGLLFACNHAEQRGFTRAVGADDADDGACWHFETQVVDQHTVAERFADIGKFDDLVT